MVHASLHLYGLLTICYSFLHKKYPKNGFNNVITPVIILYISWLCVGINSSLLSFFVVGLGGQWFLRKRYPNLFLKYNYLVSAALDGGTSIIVFIMSFAIFGAAGTTHNFRKHYLSSSMFSFCHESSLCEAFTFMNCFTDVQSTAEWWGNNLNGNFDRCLLTD